MIDDLRQRHLAYHALDQPMAAMEIDYPNGASTGPHVHPRGQLLYAIEGVMVVRSASGTWVVPPSRAVWLVAGVEHEVQMRGAVKIRTVFVDPHASADLPTENAVIAVSPLLRELIVAAVRIPLDYTTGGRDERLMQLILDELRALKILPLHLPMPHDRRLREICKAILAAPDDTSTAAHWAVRLGIAAKTVHRLFVRETGLTFAQWRQQARLLSALERIASGARIVDVALDCGYASQSAFSAMFRRHFGITPSAFFR